MLDLLKTVVETCFRFFPFPTKAGLRTFGNPNRQSPVFVTANFDLTVRRVSKVLRNLHCYLLVVNTKGINVWCAAGGGKFTASQVISAIKTSGIGDLVDHRRIILPQFCAPGVEVKEIKEKAGWHAQFGPAYAKNIPRFIANDFKKSPDMNLAKFPLSQRLEMAIMWAFPISVILSVIFSVGWPQYLLGGLLLTWAIALTMFIFLFWIPGKKGLAKAQFLSAVFVAIFVVYYFIGGRWGVGSLIGWALAAVALSTLIGFDLAGSTPLWSSETGPWFKKMGWIKNPVRFEVAVDPEKCNGCSLCIQVCPKGVYEMATAARKVVITSAPQECEECTACYVQCPTGAISLGFPHQATCSCPACKVVNAFSKTQEK